MKMSIMDEINAIKKQKQIEEQKRIDAEKKEKSIRESWKTHYTTLMMDMLNELEAPFHYKEASHHPWDYVILKGNNPIIYINVTWFPSDIDCEGYGSDEGYGIKWAIDSWPSLKDAGSFRQHTKQTFEKSFASTLANFI